MALQIEKSLHGVQYRLSMILKGISVVFILYINRDEVKIDGWEYCMNKLSYILENINGFKWSDALFLPEEEVWELDTEGLIWDPDDVEDESDEVPKAAMDLGLIHALSIQNIQDIVYNAKQQKESASADDLLEAYLYYYDNDAYIEW